MENNKEKEVKEISSKELLNVAISNEDKTIDIQKSVRIGDLVVAAAVAGLFAWTRGRK